MGTLIDTTVFVELERTAARLGVPDSTGFVAEQIAAATGESEEMGIAAITASELLHGVHRADHTHQPSRAAFVEMILSTVPVFEFSLQTARAHARLWAQLADAGTDISAHDRLIAATALSLGWRVMTANVRHFERILGLELVPLPDGA